MQPMLQTDQKYEFYVCNYYSMFVLLLPNHGVQTPPKFIGSDLGSDGALIYVTWLELLLASVRSFSCFTISGYFNDMSFTSVM